MSATYLALEMRRVLRTPAFAVFTIGFPVVLLFLYSGIFTNDAENKQVALAIIMTSMCAFGGVTASLVTGTRAAEERHAGWQRQLRLTPLSGGGYLVAKVIVGMVVALGPILLVALLGGLVQGVSLDAAGWLRVTLGVWLGMLPIALIGLFIGQTATADSVQAVTQAVMLLLTLIGGIFIPVDSMPGWLINVSKVLPTYWISQIARGAVTTDLSEGLGTAILVLAAWTVVAGALVVRRYRRDSARV
ncbi:ABC-2 type transport system permease protein [Herbihabitans rhizosphaerae]|uniref:Transport permease protein n=1 Tax=Herbihabitans rhizosphaerae TaxID=1872711 RepID=A0A4Q7L2S1_9PSEU|nr:ABC transporter permease [Herbihabitans rhizosphaerae]RZS43416.1 ABC-2 type transport system permease protein [Herbihabitans rhizosphaerae]